MTPLNLNGLTALYRTLLGILVVSLNAYAIDTNEALGPENSGLQLGLTISLEADGSHKLALEIKNNRRSAVELQIKDYRPGNRSFEKAFLEGIEFDTFPKVESYRPQTTVAIVVTKMMLRNGEAGVIGDLKDENGNLSGLTLPSSQLLSSRIEPNQSLKYTWKTESVLHSGVDYPHQIFHPFPPGKYSVRVRARLQTADEAIALWSNDQIYIFGKSLNAPKAPIGEVRSVDTENRTVQLSIGRAEGLSVGDRYFIPAMAAPTWIMTIKDFTSDGAIAKLQELRSTSFPDWKASHPTVGTKVLWLSPESEKDKK